MSVLLEKEIVEEKAELDRRFRGQGYSRERFIAEKELRRKRELASNIRYRCIQSSLLQQQDSSFAGIWKLRKQLLTDIMIITVLMAAMNRFLPCRRSCVRNRRNIRSCMPVPNEGKGRILEELPGISVIMLNAISMTEVSTEGGKVRRSHRRQSIRKNSLKAVRGALIFSFPDTASPVP